MLGIIEPSMLAALLESIFQKDHAKILEFINMASEFEAEMVIDELMLYLKEILLSGSSQITPTIIERFFRVLADAKSLLNMGTDGEFVLSLTLFKMMEALQIKDIDSMIRTLEKELSGVEVKEVVPPVGSMSITTPSVKEETFVSSVENKMIENEPYEENIELVSNSMEPSEEEPTIEPMVQEKVEPKVLDRGGKLFETLLEKLYDRNYDLGECFTHSIVYSSFEENLLTWESSANKEQKTLLKNHWGIIRMMVQEIFGFETKIKNVAKELPSKVEEGSQEVGSKIAQHQKRRDLKSQLL